ncbi:histidinol-phosphate aminotransferase family protein [Rhodocytophaga rosea]|uniref:Histidinol-phosphate aminotransferase family protein n=1 Tax=Rhodocytophaga rosea TaxID=2704465 RepID=A0A6C0GLR2_9BACT|nr:histidinol-phosphate transaminase [Rhodocytophaga rosea]QHT68583.1 histidinol-phosphate aminotransferase family protein [Rhodocytophaga rosea]
MQPTINRRNWLKSGALMAAGLTFGTGKWNMTAAAPENILLPPDRPVIKARLSSNENPFGPSEKARKALMEAIGDSYMYPRESMQHFKSLIAKEEGVSEEHILLGAGSSELLMAAALNYSLKAPGSSILSADPSYMSLIRAATQYGSGWEKVPLTKDYAHDLDAMEKQVTDKTSLVYICNPNNPTGTIVSAAKLASFCEVVSKKKPVFMDEAYIDYIPDSRKNSMINAVKKGQNVIVARTFSKVHGFAGLRIGYVIALPETVTELRKYYTGGMNIAATSVNAAIASYQDTEYMAYAIKKNAESKAFLYKTLKDAGYEYVPSYANFVLFPIQIDGKRFTEEMSKRGVSIRNWAFDNKQWCRVSMGTMEQMQMFAQAFKEIA